ncbi:30S ribosomal protein S20 [Candidatus Berkelbacteria bacterium RIFOXYA2_FULL_43_10]|uniref:Small ribosomal subunit protein bS20 n=1 Tax=Candidatus Berkelbacteria bacterium RIFOXYA2_FULL_43_10 TaxID=1797472 RepID=A0A1F5E9X1_9BACT|nr:MAG: 30S ribosomal protein S20 [Candidatus Berkelbacteria bacterium RIFOXYA2_FULL_43_10]
MPLTSSAKKALRVSIDRKTINDATRAKVKEALKGARLAISRGDKDVAEKISLAQRELDIAAKKNVIHRNRAARLKSRLVKKLAKSDIAPAPAAKPKAEAKPKVAKKTPAKKATAEKVM